MWHTHEGMGWWMVFGGILWLLFLVGIIALIAWGISKLAGDRSAAAGDEKRDALNIAKERYARGEISKEEFEQIKKDLS
jgi:putative membrane protein